MQIVIGLVGEKGSGKQTFTDFLIEIATDIKIKHMRFSDLLRDTLTMWDLPITRANLQKVSLSFNETFGKGTLSHAIYKRVQHEESQIVILDGVRWLSDEALVRSFPDNLMVYVTADPQVRFNRLIKRNEKVGESKMDFKQFMHEEKVETETLIPEIGQRANYKIFNNNELENLKSEVQKFYLDNLTTAFRNA